jgi:hypothetical protein
VRIEIEEETWETRWVEGEVREAERIVKELEPTAREHWKQAEMPICEIITAKGKQLGFSANVPSRPLQETIDAAWQDAASRIARR